MHLNKEITSGIKTFEEQYFYRCHFIEQSPLRFILYLLYTEPRIVAVFQKNVGCFFWIKIEFRCKFRETETMV